MGMEIEIKLRVPDLSAVRQRLIAEGASRRYAELETNTFFDTPSESLLKAGAGLRVRKAVDRESGRTRVVITHKGARAKSEMKIRPETELGVEDYDLATALLNQLGYEARLSFEKRRETWDLGECEVVLDELPGDLGTFVEIEGDDEACINSVREQLSLSDAPVEQRGYAVLVHSYLARSPHTTLRFA